MNANIIIADDHAIVRRGTSYLIRDILPNASILQTENFDSTVALVKQQQAHLLILEVNMTRDDSLEYISILKGYQPDMKILIFSALSDEAFVLKQIKYGANGYLNKNSPELEIKYAIKMVLERGSYISQKLSLQLANKYNALPDFSPLSKHLSARESEVAKPLVKGMGLLEISNHLNIRMSTVGTYKSRLFEKLGIKNLVELIRLYKIDGIFV